LVLLLILTGCGKSEEATPDPESEASATSEAELTWEEQYDLGIRYLSDENYKDAILAFEAAIKIDPKQAEVYLHLAEAYVAAGEPKDAILAYKAAIKADESLEEAYLELAAVYEAQENPDAARMLIEEAIAVFGEKEEFLQLLGTTSDDQSMEAMLQNYWWENSVMSRNVYRFFDDGSFVDYSVHIQSMMYEITEDYIYPNQFETRTYRIEDDRVILISEDGYETALTLGTKASFEEELGYMIDDFVADDTPVLYPSGWKPAYEYDIPLFFWQANKISKDVRSADAYPDVSVTDAHTELAYSKYDPTAVTNCYHIPEISIDGKPCAEVNAKITRDFSPILEYSKLLDQYGQHQLYGIFYDWGRHGDVISVVVKAYGNGLSAEENQYHVYYLSAKTGKEITSDELIAEFGMERSEFREAIEAVLTNCQNSPKGASFTPDMNEVQQAIPYITNCGQLGFIFVSGYSSLGYDTYSLGRITEDRTWNGWQMTPHCVEHNKAYPL